jgi:GntR family transcriptional repressor for pyruvate dehydrogenase complex
MVAIVVPMEHGVASPNADISSLVESVRALHAAGGQLPSEREMANRLNVKRHQLRRALSELRRSGDLAPARTRRERLSLHSRYGENLVHVTNPLEVIELRLIIEPGLARLASLRASAVEIGEISRWATTPPETKPDIADLNFHAAIAAASRNHLAKELFAVLRSVGRDARMRVVGVTPATCAKSVAERDGEHRRVAEAIAARNPDAAESTLRAHLLLVQRRIMERSNAGLAAA